MPIYDSLVSRFVVQPLTISVSLIVPAGGETVPVEELAELCVLDRVLSKARKVRSKYLDKVGLGHANRYS